MKKLMAELVSKLSKIDTNMTKVSEFSKIKIDLTKYNVSYMFMRGLYNFRYGEHFGFSVSHTTRQPRPGRKKTLNGRYLNKVNRCLARYSQRATTTSQPFNRAPNEPAMVRNANFKLNLVVFEQKILIFTGEIKSFVTHITENPPRHLVHIGFWSGIGQNVQKMAIFGPK